MTDTEEIVEGIARRLVEGGYQVSREIALPQGPVVRIAASRTYFSWKGLVVLSQHVVVQQLDNAKTEDMQGLFEAGFRFGRRANWVPLVRGFQFGYMVIPVIVGGGPDGGLVQYVSQAPRKRWALFELPVVVDSQERRAFFYPGTSLWGAVYFSDMRRVVERYILSPKADPDTFA